MMGAVLQTVNVRLSPEQIAYTIDHAGASTLLVNDDFVGLLEGLKAQLPKIKRLIVMSDRSAPQTGSLSFVGEYESLLAAASPDYDFLDFDENTQATTFYTTGTTGLPKGVYYSHRQLVLHSLSGLALFGMAGTQGPLSRADVDIAITQRCHVRSEALTGDADGEADFRTRAGMAGPLVDLRIVDSEMNDVPHDGKSPGEIVLRAPWLTQGYFDNPETSEQLWAGGYLHTNDIAVVSPDGYVHITDRIKDGVRNGSEGVSSQQIEDLMSRGCGWAETAVIA